MQRLFFLLLCLVLAPLAMAQQQGTASDQTPVPNSGAEPAQSSPNDIPTPDDPPSASAPPQGQPSDQPDAVKKPSRGERVKDHLKKQMSSWCIGAPVGRCYEKDPSAAKDSKDSEPQVQRPPRSDDPEPTSRESTTPPVTPGESSSKDTKIDLSPPLGDASDHPDSSPEPDETGEFHAWDPHRAMKNVEVGDYYYKRQNYVAAASRYEEALQWKPRDAEATYKLADAQEKLGRKNDARKNYQAYLKILPKGPRALDARDALTRLQK